MFQSQRAQTIVAASAKGTASQTPRIPNSEGSVSRHIVKKPKVRRKDTIAECFPSDKAVKAAEIKIFTPQHKNAVEKMGKPMAAI